MANLTLSGASAARVPVPAAVAFWWKRDGDPLFGGGGGVGRQRFRLAVFAGATCAFRIDAMTFSEQRPRRRADYDVADGVVAGEVRPVVDDETGVLGGW